MLSIIFLIVNGKTQSLYSRIIELLALDLKG